MIHAYHRFVHGAAMLTVLSYHEAAFSGRNTAKLLTSNFADIGHICVFTVENFWPLFAKAAAFFTFYSGAVLCAVPFRTDNRQGITESKMGN